MSDYLSNAYDDSLKKLFEREVRCDMLTYALAASIGVNLVLAYYLLAR